MRQQTRSPKEPAEKVVQDIRRATRKHYSAEEKSDRAATAARLPETEVRNLNVLVCCREKRT